MKAYVLEGINQLEYKDVPTPIISSGEVLVKVMAAGICGSDIPRIFETGTYHFPTIPGHEFAGIVEDAFDDNNKSWIGKRVGVFPLMPCFECTSCKNKQYEMCSNYNYLGSRTDGGFAEYVKVPVWNLIELPDNVDFENAAMLEPTAVALHAIRQVNIDKGNSVAIYGAGTIGLLCAMWLKAFEVENVYIIGTRNEQKKLIDDNKLGTFFNIHDGSPVEWIHDNTNNYGVNVVLECVGSEESILNSISSCAANGNVVFVGNPKTDIPFFKNVYWGILRRQLHISGTWNSSFTHENSDDWVTAVKAISCGGICPRRLVTHKVEVLDDGLEVMGDRQTFSVKVLLR